MTDALYFAPRFDVRVSGATLSGDITRQLISVHYESDLDVASMVRLVVRNAEHQFTDSALFSLGKTIELQMGYGARLHPMMLGEITSIQPTFPESGSPTITVIGYDKSHRLRHNQPSRPAFQFMNHSLIASQIALEAGLIPVVDPSPFFYEKLTQVESDMALLKELARANFFDVYVHWDKLYFQFPRPQTAAMVLEWGRNLSSFTPRVSSAGMAGLQVIRGYNEELAQTIVGFATTMDLDLDSIVERLGSSVTELLAGMGRRILHGECVKSPFDAALFAKALLQEVFDGMYEGSGSCIGLPELQAGTFVSILGVGKRFSGKYRLKKVSHTMDGAGYRTNFEVTQRGGGTLLSVLRKSMLESPAPNRAQRFYGTVLGKVTQNFDPQGLGRVQVVFPCFSDTDESAWARCATPMAGGGEGMYFLPDIGDEVMVMFEHGDFNKPMVVGSLWNGTARPPVGKTDNSNYVRTIQTAAGHRVVLDDTPGKEELTLQDKSGSLIRLKQDGSIELSAKKDLLLQAKGNISFVSEQQTTLDAKAELTLSSGKAVKIDGKTNDIELDAGNVKVNVTGTMDVK